LWLPCGHDRNKDAARGVDKGPAAGDAEPRHPTSEARAQRLQTNRYRAKLVRRGDIPQANGTASPLGLPAREETLVHLAWATLCTALDAHDFLDGR
jgi:hypothetical protein